MREDERPPVFDCEISRSGQTVTARLKGELDLVSCDQADSALTAAVEGSGERVVIDLRELTFMDSSGLRLLLKWEAGSREDGFDLEIIPGPAHVHRLLEVTGLTEHFRLAEPDG